jgi:hypothetical protein
MTSWPPEFLAADSGVTLRCTDAGGLFEAKKRHQPPDLPAMQLGSNRSRMLGGAINDIYLVNSRSHNLQLMLLVAKNLLRQARKSLSNG